MYCIKCGTQNEDGYKYCYKCGSELLVDAPQSKPQEGLRKTTAKEEHTMIAEVIMATMLIVLCAGAAIGCAVIYRQYKAERTIALLKNGEYTEAINKGTESPKITEFVVNAAKNCLDSYNDDESKYPELQKTMDGLMSYAASVETNKEFLDVVEQWNALSASKQSFAKAQKAKDDIDAIIEYKSVLKWDSNYENASVECQHALEDIYDSFVKRIDACDENMSEDELNGVKQQLKNELKRDYDLLVSENDHTIETGEPNVGDDINVAGIFNAYYVELDSRIGRIGYKSDVTYEELNELIENAEETIEKAAKYSTDSIKKRRASNTRNIN